MTQSSRPQADNTANGYTDSGPYSRDQWSKKLIIENVGDAVTDRGPFAGYLNRLEVTNPAGVTFQVDTGAGYCNGSLLDNTATVSFTATAPAANPRIDIVCIVENNTNAAVNNGTAANGWIFPGTLTDYNGLSSVPAYSARLVIVKGAENVAPVAPALDQSSALYMIPLAQYQISVVPAISALTDLRDYVDAEIKALFLQPQGAHNITDGTDIVAELVGSAGMLFELTDAKECAGFGRMAMPVDYIDAMEVSGVIYDITPGGGNIYATTNGAYGGCGESYVARSDTSGAAAEAIGAVGTYSCHRTLDVASALTSDIMSLVFDRDATDVLDTIGHDIYFVGFSIEYLGYR